MFSDPVFLIAVIACAAVAAILAMGISGFAKSGEAAGQRSNRFMRYRIGAQLLAVLIIIGLVWWRGRG
jgi:hypothetical protein